MAAGMADTNALMLVKQGAHKGRPYGMSIL
jgi:hypothetical protein